MVQCSRPFWDLLNDAVTDPSALFDWVFCPYGIEIGLASVGALVLTMAFVGIKNWSESWSLPLVWLALVGPIVASQALPGGVIRQIAGVLTVAFAMLLIGIWWWWGRS